MSDESKGLRPGMWCKPKDAEERKAILALAKSMRIAHMANLWGYDQAPYVMNTREGVLDWAEPSGVGDTFIPVPEFIARMYEEKEKREQAEINKNKEPVTVSTRTITPAQHREAMDKFLEEVSRPTNRQMLDDHEKRIKALEEKDIDMDSRVKDEALAKYGELWNSLISKLVPAIESRLAALEGKLAASSISPREQSLEIGHLKERVIKLEGGKEFAKACGTYVVADPVEGWHISIAPGASPKNIPFSVALEYLKQGRTVRRSGWSDGKCFVRLAPRKDALVYGDAMGLTHCGWSSGTSEVLATDWEVLPE